MQNSFCRPVRPTSDLQLNLGNNDLHVFCPCCHLLTKRFDALTSLAAFKGLQETTPIRTGLIAWQAIIPITVATKLSSVSSRESRGRPGRRSGGPGRSNRAVGDLLSFFEVPGAPGLIPDHPLDVFQFAATLKMPLIINKHFQKVFKLALQRLLSSSLTANLGSDDVQLPQRNACPTHLLTGAI